MMKINNSIVKLLNLSIGRGLLLVKREDKWQKQDEREKYVMEEYEWAGTT